MLKIYCLTHNLPNNYYYILLKTWDSIVLIVRCPYVVFSPIVRFSMVVSVSQRLSFSNILTYRKQYVFVGYSLSEHVKGIYRSLSRWSMLAVVPLRHRSSFWLVNPIFFSLMNLNLHSSVTQQIRWGVLCRLMLLVALYMMSMPRVALIVL